MCIFKERQFYKLHTLSHSYIDSNTRAWKGNCVIYAERNWNCPVGLDFSDVEYSFANYTYRYAHALYNHELVDSMFTQVKDVTKSGAKKHEYILSGGTDLQTMKLLQRRLGFNIKFYLVYHDFSKPELWHGNQMGQFYHDLADTVSGATRMSYYNSHIQTAPVANYYDLNIGLTFYTALPQKMPMWQAIFFVFQWNVGLPLILAILFKKVGLYPDYGKVLTWLFHAITGKGTAMRSLNLKTYSLSLLTVTWTLVAAILSYGYTGGLMSVMTKPSLEMSPETWKDVIDMNYAIKSTTRVDTGEDRMGLQYLFVGPEGSVYSTIMERLNTDFGGGNQFWNYHA